MTVSSVSYVPVAVTRRHSSSSATGAVRRQHVADRRRVARPRWPDDGVAVLAVVEPVELPLAEPPRGVASSDDDEREEQPAPTDRNRNDRTARGYPAPGASAASATTT